MSLKPVIKGAIFRRVSSKNGKFYYFRSKGRGETVFKNAAYVYSCQEIADLQLKQPDWATNDDGKWLLVYE